MYPTAVRIAYSSHCDSPDIEHIGSAPRGTIDPKLTSIGLIHLARIGSLACFA